jgi:putative flippase GtrA
MRSSFLSLAGQSRFAPLFKFGVIGSLGFVCDNAVVYTMRPLIGLTAATLLAYFIAATFNWLLNRLWTFRGRGLHHHPFVQWLRFLWANSLGFCLNRGMVFSLFYLFPFCERYPVVALAAGTLTGLLSNFKLSQKLVFHDRKPTCSTGNASGGS